MKTFKPSWRSWLARQSHNGDFENFDHLRPKVWYGNDCKNMENLLKHKLEKMLIFDQKILEVANLKVVSSSLTEGILLFRQLNA